GSDAQGQNMETRFGPEEAASAELTLEHHIGGGPINDRRVIVKAASERRANIAWFHSNQHDRGAGLGTQRFGQLFADKSRGEMFGKKSQGYCRLPGPVRNRISKDFPLLCAEQLLKIHSRRGVTTEPPTTPSEPLKYRYRV